MAFAELALLPQSLLAHSLEQALARCLKRSDARVKTHLQSLGGRIIALRFTPGLGQLFLCPNAEGIQILHECTTPADLTLSASPLAFWKLALGHDSHGALFRGDIDLRGNADLAQRFNQLLKHLEMPWQTLGRQLPKLPGMTAILQRKQQMQQWRAELHEKIWLDSQELLQEETQTTPTVYEAAAQFNAIDRLRDDAERLDARLARLEKTRLTPQTPQDDSSP